jgi:hypothetical protein
MNYNECRGSTVSSKKFKYCYVWSTLVHSINDYIKLASNTLPEWLIDLLQDKPDAYIDTVEIKMIGPWLTYAGRRGYLFLLWL